MLNNCCAPADSASSLPLKLWHCTHCLICLIVSNPHSRLEGCCLRILSLNPPGWKTRAPEGTTFPHCHQLYQGLIKYRLCAVLVLTYLMAHSMGRVHRDHGQNLGGAGVEHDPKMREITQHKEWPWWVKPGQLREWMNEWVSEWMNK